MERDKGRRKRHGERRGRSKFDGGSQRGPFQDEDTTVQRPIILAKPEHRTVLSSSTSTNHTDESSDNKTQEKVPVFTLKTREESKVEAGSSQTPVFTLKTREETKAEAVSSSQAPHIPSILAGDSIGSPVIVAHRSKAESKQKEKPKLNFAPQMTQCVKIVDENMAWCNAGMEVLRDYNDYFVIGVIGMQGSGKSTIMSLLADFEPNRRNFVFPTQSYDILESFGHQTDGIDMYVTKERIILLDVQPVLSASVLEKSGRLASEGHMQSIHFSSFLMAVCHEVIVCMDWFADLNLIKFIKSAEMLKPATPTKNTDTAKLDESHVEHYPHTVFVLNKATREDFTVESYADMQKYLKHHYKKSYLKTTGPVHMADVIPALRTSEEENLINLFLIPEIDARQAHGSPDELFSPSGYRGHPDAETLIRKLRKKLVSLPHHKLQHAPLTEKNWFKYAAKTWDSFKKSSAYQEYHRLIVQ